MGGLFACSSLDDGSLGQVEEKERWNYRNDPSNFTDITLKYDFDSLPSGRAEQDIIILVHVRKQHQRALERR